MKKATLLLALFALTNFSQAQKASILYNEKRQLKADTSLVLTPEAYKVWLELESSTLYHLVNCYRPTPIVHENNVTTSCIFSITTELDGENMTVAIVEILEAEEQLRPFTKALIYPVQECFTSHKQLKDEVKYSKSQMVFYLPLAAPIEPIENWVGPNGMLNLRKPSIPFYFSH